jgi:heme a synthase
LRAPRGAAPVTGGGPVHRFACATAGATVLLIVAGGLVTTTGAGLAVPDWPTTFGESMLLYPWSRLAGGVLVEHSHRLIGAAIGLFTVALAVTLALADGRGWVRGLGGLAVALVTLQGVIGGLRVVLRQDALAIVHGCLAPAFFALLVVLAVVTGRGWAAPAGRTPAGRWLAAAAAGAAGLVYGQVVLGALTTHAGWLGWHVGGAVVTTGGLGALLAGVRRGAPGDPTLGWWAGVLTGGLALQLALGLGAYVVRFTDLGVPGGALAAVALPVAHRAVGAVLLGSTVALALHLARRRQVGGRIGSPARAALRSTAVTA